MMNTDKVKLEKESQDAEILNNAERIQFSIAISLRRIANLMEKIYVDGVNVSVPEV
jgi:hypothetical protein